MLINLDRKVIFLPTLFCSYCHLFELRLLEEKRDQAEGEGEEGGGEAEGEGSGADGAAEEGEQLRDNCFGDGLILEEMFAPLVTPNGGGLNEFENGS